MRPLTATLTASVTATLALASSVALAAPAAAHGDRDSLERSALREATTTSIVASPNVKHLSANPSQAGISGCFLKTAPLLVTSGSESVRVWDVSDAARPKTVGVLANALFENEAMTCGERKSATGVKRFALIGVDLVQATPGDIDHTNVGGKELVVVDVTDPTTPSIRSRVAGTTSTHTVACVADTDCKYAYSAGSRNSFSVFDLRRLDKPREVDSDAGAPGIQPFSSPTGGHKWNFDAAGIGTHTGWNGASMWSTTDPARPKLITTTGKAGQGTDPRYPEWNNFILHNAFRPNAKAFRPGARPALRNGNILLVTEEDYEQTDCSQAGSFQTWWVKRLNGRRSAIVPLDKVELSDLGNFPLPRGAFCSSHWFDFRPGGLVAVGFYGGGTQILDVSKPRDIRPFGHAIWGASEVWDNMWVPSYSRSGRQTGGKTNVLYAIDLVRGLDVYAVDVPGDGRGAVPPARAEQDPSVMDSAASGVLPVGLVGGAMALALALRRRRRD